MPHPELLVLLDASREVGAPGELARDQDREVGSSAGDPLVHARCLVVLGSLAVVYATPLSFLLNRAAADAAPFAALVFLIHARF